MFKASQQALTVPCPVCDADAGERCRGWFGWWPHRGRLGEAEYVAEMRAAREDGER